MIEKKVERLLAADYRPEHSEFQVENFIIGAQGNEWARYKQALRELASRVDGIKAKAADIRSLAVEVKRAGSGGWNPIGRKKRRLVAALMRSKLKAERSAFRSRMREFVQFYRIAIELKRSLGEISADRWRGLESEMWTEKARRMAALDLISLNGLQRSTV